jgi:hypothetical protein
MNIPSHDLAEAIHEAIRAHADRHRGGTVDMKKTLSALGEVVAHFLGHLTRRRESYARRALFHNIMMATVRKRLQLKGEAPTTLQ